MGERIAAQLEAATASRLYVCGHGRDPHASLSIGNGGWRGWCVECRRYQLVKIDG